MRPPLPRRFYQKAGVEEAEGGFRVVLDGRPVRTPARGFLIAPSRKLAQAVAAEWDAQGETIDPATMPVTRLANSITDGVAAAPRPVAADVEKYLASDLLFYRADGPQRRGAIAAARAAIPTDPWRLGAVHVITTLTGSALLALALLRGHLTADEAWAAAHVDEDWNMEQWGRDEIALARRAARRAELNAAATVLATV